MNGGVQHFEEPRAPPAVLCTSGRGFSSSRPHVTRPCAQRLRNTGNTYAGSRRAMGPGDAAVKFWLGPPVPLGITRLMRALQLAVLVAMMCWISIYLGGLRLTPRPATDGQSNDTGQLFNWHPLLMTLGFPILMAEALLAYKAPLVELKDRPHSKAYHFVLHTAALLCTILGVVTAFKSHTLKRPTPLPNLYSTHSWLGVSVLSLLTFQYCLGATAYLFPKLSPAHRRALAPLHIFLGRAIFTAGLATMAVGIQEKATFIQAFTKPASVHAGIMSLPAAIEVLLLLTAMAVLFHHVAPATLALKQWGEEDIVSLVAGAEPAQGLAPSDDDSHMA